MQPPMDAATRVDLYHHYPQMNPEKDKYMVSKAKMKADIAKLQTERAVLASSVTRMQLEVEDIQHHLAMSKNKLARLAKLDVLEKERDSLVLENALLRRQQLYQVTAAQQAALSEKVCDCKCKEKSQQDIEGVKRLLNSARKSSIRKIKSLMLDLEEHKSLLAEARQERSAATTQLIDLQNENSLLRSELKAASEAPSSKPAEDWSYSEMVKSMEQQLQVLGEALSHVKQQSNMFQSDRGVQGPDVGAAQELEGVLQERNKLKDENHAFRETVSQLKARVAFLEGKETECVQND